MRWVWIVPLLAVAGGCAGGSGRSAAGDSADFVRPTIAVMKFENRAPFPLRWDLGTGTRDVLVDRLVSSGRYRVIERPEIDSILRELNFQQSGMTRPQERAQLGRLTNVQYLIKGTITDFSHVSSTRAGAAGRSWGFSGGGHRAVMGIVIYVVDVESGEIIASESIQESVRATDADVRAVYRDVAFGGSVFYRTPLGEATAKVIDRAVGRVTHAVANQPWTPRVAAVQEDGRVILNGGADRSLRAGALFQVAEAGEPILDPQTGDLLGRQPGRPVAQIRVMEVHARYSIAEVVDGAAGELTVGQAAVVMP